MLSEADIFSSVFPAATLHHTTPTPVATPDLGFTAAGQSFGGVTSPASQRGLQSLSAAQLQVKRSIAWSSATRFLSLASLTSEELEAGHKLGDTRRSKTREVREAMDFLLSGNGLHGQHDGDWDLVCRRLVVPVDLNSVANTRSMQIEWYTLEARSHFLDNVAPVMQDAWSTVSP
jgi:anaphase-promoting complex subunit 2